ncbi:Hsp20/alpha crystallin family protein [Dokdonella sp.]|uniref:Hsp20/alpha crystallin family protein n=1 Tax=Dokdonella sp. TaxID=2291710 RepID=UPI0026311F53|nr:Hsp20/alpha crystallin family protein [Dokdonella sp.]
MSMLTHWNPSRSLARLDPARDFDEFFRSFGLRPAPRDLEVTPDIRLDVSEDDRNYIVKAEIPGAAKENIELSVDGNQVSIGVEVKRESEKKNGERELYTERSYGSARRVFTLPVDVDADKVEARYEHGILTVKLPKAPGGKSHRVAIS